jgi:GDPmannose 4,6-dehydratase
MAFSLVGLNWEAFTRVDPAYFRPTDVESLCADPTKASARLGWKPETSFRELIELMVTHDLAEIGLDLATARDRVSAFAPEQRADT